MPECEVKVHREGKEITVELIDEDGNSFIGKAIDRDPDAYNMYSGEYTCVIVEGPMKVNGEYVEEQEVAFLLADEVSVEPSDELKFLPLRWGSFACRQSVFLTVDGKRTEITTRMPWESTT